MTETKRMHLTMIWRWILPEQQSEVLWYWSLWTCYYSFGKKSKDCGWKKNQSPTQETALWPNHGSFSLLHQLCCFSGTFMSLPLSASRWSGDVESRCKALIANKCENDLDSRKNPLTWANPIGVQVSNSPWRTPLRRWKCCLLASFQRRGGGGVSEVAKHSKL